MVPQSPEGTFASGPALARSHSIRDRIACSASQVDFPELTTFPASSGAVRQVNRGGTIVDSSDDGPLVQRVSIGPAGLLRSTLWDTRRTRSLAPHQLPQFQGHVATAGPKPTVSGHRQEDAQKDEFGLESDRP